MKYIARLVLVVSLVLLVQGSAIAASLVGSKEAVLSAYNKAKAEDLSFLTTREQIEDFARRGLRSTVSKSEKLELIDVGYPYAVPAVVLFLSRLSAQYHGSCSEKLFVTSLMRPTSEQPVNASTFSVHPTGMAVDLRIPTTPTCRAWIERTLLTMEERGVIDATRELYPPHYHVVVYPTEYIAYVERKGGEIVPEERSDWFATLQSAFYEHVGLILWLPAVLLGLWFMYRALIHRRAFRLPKRRASIIAAISVLLVTGLLGSAYQVLLPHEGWEKRSNELTALATALYWEGAMTESTEGLHAIAWTIFNRQRSRDYPASIREVVSQGVRPGKEDGCQFSFACDGEVETPQRLCELHPNDSKVLGWMGCERRYLWHLALAAWWLYINRGNDPTNNAVLYYTGPVPYWISDCVEGSLRRIGSHNFCQSKWNS